MKNFITLFTSLLLFLLFVGCSDSDDVTGTGAGSGSQLESLYGAWILVSEAYEDNSDTATIKDVVLEYSLTDTSKYLADELLIFKENESVNVIKCAYNGQEVVNEDNIYTSAGDYLYFDKEDAANNYSLYSVSGSSLSITRFSSYADLKTVYKYQRYTDVISPSVWDSVYAGKINFKSSFDLQ